MNGYINETYSSFENVTGFLSINKWLTSIETKSNGTR